MTKSARLFHCTDCNKQVIICSECDRNQIYCSQECSQTARQAACREAGKRYQTTHRGRLKHAVRQRRYRQHQQKKEIVTHQGSPENSSHDVLLVEPNEAKPVKTTTLPDESCCHFCKKPVSKFLRRDFLRRDRGNLLATEF